MTTVALEITGPVSIVSLASWNRSSAASPAVPPQNPVNGAIVDVSALGVELAYPDASLAVPPARNRQIEPEAAARARAREPRLATAVGHCATQDQTPETVQD